MIQLNVRKQGEIHDSLMNDEEIRDATVLAIQEPHARRIQGRLLTTPMGHHKWTKIVPSSWRVEKWPIRSMLWVNKEVEAEAGPDRVSGHDRSDHPAPGTSGHGGVSLRTKSRPPGADMGRDADVALPQNQSALKTLHQPLWLSAQVSNPCQAHLGNRQLRATLRQRTTR